MNIRAELSKEQEARRRYSLPWYKHEGFTVIDHDPDTRAYDVLLEKDGKRFRVEEKFNRRNGPGTAGLLVELVQCVVEKSWGWFLTHDFDRLNYFLCEDWRPVHVFEVDWRQAQPFVRRVLTDDDCWKRVQRMDYSGFIRSAKGWGVTLNFRIPWKALPKGSYRSRKVSLAAPARDTLGSERRLPKLSDLPRCPSGNGHRWTRWKGPDMGACYDCGIVHSLGRVPASRNGDQGTLFASP